MYKQTKTQNKINYKKKTYIHYFQRTKESEFGDTFLKPLNDKEKEKEKRKKERRKEKEQKAQYPTKQVLCTLRLWN